jgi:hypothetical protein
VKKPDFDELVGRDLPERERERLRRVHDLLVAAGPPAEVPPSLAEPPSRAEGAEVVPLRVPPRRRIALLIAATLTALAFGAGFFLGDRSSDRPAAESFRAVDALQLEPVAQDSDAVAVVQLGERQDDGNWSMVLTVEGLPHLPKGDYYELFMTKDGERFVTCGSFNVAGRFERTTVRFSVAYDRAQYDGMSLTRYTHAGHRVRELMRA